MPLALKIKIWRWTVIDRTKSMTVRSIWLIFETVTEMARTGLKASGAMNSWLSRCVTTERRNVVFIILEGALEHTQLMEWPC